MLQVQETKRRRYRPEELGERDWMPRACVKMPFLYKTWLRDFLCYLIKRRVEARQDAVTITLDEYDYVSLSEIVVHFDNARLIKSSVEPLTQYGGRDAASR